MLELFMLLAAQPDRLRVLAIHHLQSQADVIAGAELIDEPANAMGVMRFVARHSSCLMEAAERIARYCRSECPVFVFGISVRDIARVNIEAPWAFFALARALQLPPSHSIPPTNPIAAAAASNAK